MRARELAELLIRLADQHGDLEVGIFNNEFEFHDVCVHAYFHEAQRPVRSVFGDDSRLGEVFIGIKS